MMAEVEFGAYREGVRDEIRGVPAPCEHADITKLKPAEYAFTGFTRWRCGLCGVEWGDPETESPWSRYQIAWGKQGKDTRVVRDGQELRNVVEISVNASLNKPTSVTITEVAMVSEFEEPIV